VTTVAWISIAAALGLPTVIGFVLRALVLDRIKQLEEANIRQGKRIGDLESWTFAHDAVESERRRVDTRGVPVVDEGRKGRGR
jgi:hypothetical protein